MSEHTEQAVLAISGVAAKGGSATAVASGVAGRVIENHQLITDMGIIVGIMVGIGGLAVNVFFNWRRDRRETTVHKAKMRKLNSEG